MGTAEETLKCPACQDFFTDPVKLPCRHDFCLSCIQAVCEEGPLFCPECQILLPSNLTLEIDASLQSKVKDFIIKSSTPVLPTEINSSSTICCDHCIKTPSEAIQTCLTCDASLCQAHALLHQQRSALREHTVVEVTQDLLSLKCKDHRDELKLFCLEERVPVCCLCVLVGAHKNHRAAQLNEACTDLKRMLEATMKQLLQMRCEAENAIKDLEFMYTQTVVPSIHPFSPASPGRVAGEVASAGIPRLPFPQLLLPALPEGSRGIPSQLRDIVSSACSGSSPGALSGGTVTMSAADFRERISDKYSRIRVVLDGDERLMMQIIDAEEEYMTEWLEAQRGHMEARIKEIDDQRVSSKLLLQEVHDLSFIQQITAQNLCDPPKLAPIPQIDKELCEPDKLRTIEKLVDDLSVALSQHFPRMWSYLSCPALDLKTAHPKLNISRDGRQVCWGMQPDSEPSTTQPYNSQYSVLSQKSLITGHHYWEVIVQEKPYWLIGVTTGPVPGDLGPSLGPSALIVNKTSWCIYHGEGQYMACHDTQEKQLQVRKKVRKLGILANLPKGELSFYDADTMTLLHSFLVKCKKPLFPMFNPCIDVNGLNRHPLTMFWIKHPWDWSVDTDGGDK
ncbi:E3 ubiquitin-protein ligase Midline-1-like isoform X1 [Syngnathoides biaculeatus]|uniref:E3 ubiquitin-protein ligase Midline-1-like isoform X1 n=1 Tax=Syngnathoides biaculeatus TaxID=300417 RepID=UPI002ADE5196|nr:E3 ubiquitin-protein ligase Midline-1-like isoform X1 [Syngnathoides biaculeatus]